MVQQKGEEKETEQTPTLETQVDALKLRLEKTEEELTQTRKGLSSAHQTLTEKDKELKRRAQVEEDIASIKDQIEVLASVIATGRTDHEENSDQTPARDALATLKREQQERERKRLQEEFAAEVTKFRVRTDALALDPESEEYLDIQDLATRGNFKLAEIRLKKLEVKQVEERAKTRLPAAEEIEKMAEERARKLLEERGLLQTDKGQPGGTGVGKTYTRSEIRNMLPGEYRKAFPAYADYLRAFQEGRIKE